MKQTAVQWLIEYMTENFYLTDQSLEQFDVAKEMEKKQLLDNWVASRWSALLSEKTLEESFEQYYRETYITNNDQVL